MPVRRAYTTLHTTPLCRLCPKTNLTQTPSVSEGIHLALDLPPLDFLELFLCFFVDDSLAE